MLSFDQCVRVLTRIAARKTAPFYEARVADFVTAELNEAGIPWEFDEVGNIIARCVGASGREGGPLVLVAHMDHPAFEILDKSGRSGRMLGNVRMECFDAPVDVLVYPALPECAVGDERGVPGVITGAKRREAGVYFRLDMRGKCPPLPAFGVWDFPDIEVRDRLAYMRACDDVVSCAVMLTVMREAKRRRIPCDIIGVFTRAEEVCFAGSMHVARKHAIPPDSVVVSLEVSKALPGAEIGGGPVIRTGDRLHTFADSAECVLRQAAIEVKKARPEARVQRQLMSGGMCEASIFTIEGYCTTAMALPLGNYHNVGPDMTLAPEFISPADMAVEIEVLLQAAQMCFAECRDIDRGLSLGGYEEGLRKLGANPIARGCIRSVR